MASKASKKSAVFARAKPAEQERRATLWWAHALVVSGLMLANLAFYQGTVGLGFLSVDDPDYIQNNPLLNGFGASNLKRILIEPYFANYAPLNILSYLLDVALAGGKSATAIHLSNVLWHGWVVCMVYLLAFTIRAEIFTAAAAALLFLLHPAHVEVVAWISSRKDLVATGFAALSMTCYLLSRRRSTRPAWWYWASVFCFLLASAAKQSVVLLPLVMLLWDLIVENRRGWRVLADKIPFGLLTIFFGWMTWHAQPSTNQTWSPFVLAATAFTNLWLLTGLGQYVLYRPAPHATAWPKIARVAMISAGALIWLLPLLLGKVLVRLREALKGQRLQREPRSTPRPVLLRSSPGAFSATFIGLCYWVLINMAPLMVLNFIVPITDRYLFLPSVGVCLLLAQSASEVAGKGQRARWLGYALLAGIAIAWSAKTSNYINEWRDPRSVWYGAHLKTKNPQVFQFLGEIYHNAGERIDNFIKSGAGVSPTNEIQLAQAVLNDTTLTEQLRDEWSGITPARTNSLIYRDRLWSLAWDQYEEAVLRRGTLSAPNLFMNRGRLLVSQGKPAQAIPEFQKALVFGQTSSYDVIRHEMVTHALYAIGVAHWNLRNYPEAQQWLLKAQEAQRKSGHGWIPSLDRDVERIKSLAASQR